MRRFFTIGLLPAAVWLAGACTPDPGPDAVSAPESPAASALLPAASEPGECPAGGRLTATLYGALAGEIDWRANDMSCEGMPRPGGAGARLRFAGAAGADDTPIAVIIAIPRLQRGETATDLPSNVTIIEEGKGRFFSTTDLEYCWVDVESIETSPGQPDVSKVSGILNCIAPLAETNGSTSVTIDKLAFSGFVDWGTG